MGGATCDPFCAYGTQARPKHALTIGGVVGSSGTDGEETGWLRDDRLDDFSRIMIGYGSASPCQDYRVNALPTQKAPPSSEILVGLRNHEAAAPPALGVLGLPLQSRHTHRPLARPSHT